MHPEIIEILRSFDTTYPYPEMAVLKNAMQILNYMDDINIERTSRFEHTPAESLYICWNVSEMEFHIECLKNGRVSYTFRKAGYYKSFGTDTIDQFIPRLESYLLAGMC
jgi:hypothetical protein